MLDELFNTTEDKLKKTILNMKSDFSKLVLNKVNLSLLDDIKISYYGDKYPLPQLAILLVENANSLSIKPFDKKNLTIIHKEIINLNLDLNPFISGDTIKVIFPKLTSERRDFFIKKIKKIGEDTKVSIRNIRRQSNQKIKSLLKENGISQDEEKLFLNKIQCLIDKYIHEIDSLVNKKEKDLLII